MTEADWLACTDPRRMLGFLRGKASERKWRLFACALCRAVRGTLYLGAGPALVDGMLAALEVAPSP